MKFNSLFSLSLALILGTLSACTQKSDSDRHEISQVSVGAALNSPLPPAEKAEELAKQAETLLSAQGILQAAETAELALREDSKNERAGLIKAVLGPIMAQKGILIRIQPLVNKGPEALAHYQAQLEKFRNEQPESALKSFLLDGTPDIENETDLQKHLDTLGEALERLRLFTKNIQAPEMKVKASGLLLKDLNRRFALACQIIETASYEYELACPPSETRHSVTLNQADFHLISDMATYFFVQTVLGTSYDMSGALDFLAAEKKSRVKRSTQEISDILLANQKFGKLNSQSQIKRIKGLGLDLVTALHWALNNQKELCPTGQEGSRNRPGTLFYNGYCVSPFLLSYVKTAESIFKGETQDFDGDRDGKSLRTSFQPIAPFETPISDFRSLGMRFDSCGQVSSFQDPTAGGLFPRGDVNALIPLRIGACK